MDEKYSNVDLLFHKVSIMFINLLFYVIPYLQISEASIITLK
jgi:hypothetical protein